MCWCLFCTLLCNSCSKNPSVPSPSVAPWLKVLLALPWALSNFCSWSSVLAFLSLCTNMALLGGDRVLPGHGGLWLGLLVKMRKRLHTSIHPENTVLSHKTVQCHCVFKCLLSQYFAYHFKISELLFNLTEGMSRGIGLCAMTAHKDVGFLFKCLWTCCIFW